MTSLIRTGWEQSYFSWQSMHLHEKESVTTVPKGSANLNYVSESQTNSHWLGCQSSVSGPSCCIQQGPSWGQTRAVQLGAGGVENHPPPVRMCPLEMSRPRLMHFCRSSSNNCTRTHQLWGTAPDTHGRPLLRKLNINFKGSSPEGV